MKLVSTPLQSGFFRYFTQYIEQMPFRDIDFSDSFDVERHNKVTALVERMLKLHVTLSATSVPNDKTLYQRQIKDTDDQIDALIYDLYDLTEEEIRIVDESMD